MGIATRSNVQLWLAPPGRSIGARSVASSSDSPLEQTRFELLVPIEKPWRSAERQRVRRHRHAATPIEEDRFVTDSSIVGSSRIKLGPPEPAPHADLEFEPRGMLWRCSAWLFASARDEAADAD